MGKAWIERMVAGVGPRSGVREPFSIRVYNDPTEIRPVRRINPAAAS